MIRNTVNVLTISAPRTLQQIGQKISEFICDVLGGYMVGKLSMYLQCICDVLAWNTGICPQWLLLSGTLSGSLVIFSDFRGLENLQCLASGRDIKTVR
jgi:hypothetical protein